MLVELSERVRKYIDTEEFLKTKDLGIVDDGSIRAKRKQDDFDRGSGKNQKLNQ